MQKEMPGFCVSGHVVSCEKILVLTILTVGDLVTQAAEIIFGLPQLCGRGRLDPTVYPPRAAHSAQPINMSGNQVLLFVIVGRNEPLYEVELNKRGGSGTADATTRQNYFILHSALDLVERAAWTTNRMHLGVIDKVNNQQVSTFLTAGNIKFMLLHSGRNDDSIRNFFQDVYELYVKLSLNPFYRYDTPINSTAFDTRVKALARKYL